MPKIMESSIVYWAIRWFASSDAGGMATVGLPRLHARYEVDHWLAQSREKLPKNPGKSLGQANVVVLHQPI